MSAIMDDDDSPVFIYTDDPECQSETQLKDLSETQLKDLSVGDPFIFRGERFRKRNDYGWGLGICNIVNAKGEVSHIHPTTRITLIQ
jgi:hypothetical protein